MSTETKHTHDCNQNTPESYREWRIEALEQKLARSEQRISSLEAQLHTEREERKAVIDDALVYRCNQLEAQNKELREALKKYGVHRNTCDFAFDDRPCNCGLDKALSGGG